MGFTKKSFAVELSKLKVFLKPKEKLEQYSTDSEVAAVVLWDAALRGDIEGKNVIDLGAGTGILGLGALLLGAKKVTFVDIDNDALNIAKENYETIKKDFDIENAEVNFLNLDVENLEKKAEVVVQNPPFGIKDEHADKKFLEKAFTIAPVIYSIHMLESKKFIESISADFRYEITAFEELSFPLKQTLKHHTKKIHRIMVGTWRLEKTN